ncbi:MAG: phosphatase PAP2 family protein [Pseudomonadota bacterium]
MLIELVAELTVLVALVLFGDVALKSYVRYRQPWYSQFLLKRRLAVMGLLVLLIVGAKVFEDVLAQESGVVDRFILTSIRAHMPASLYGFFNAVTVAGSALTVVPVAVVAALGLLMLKRRAEALLITASLATAASAVYLIKTATGRARPALWETEWFWGSSFPSGHTSHTAAVATALALCAGRLWPGCGRWAMALALGWTSLVALSRLVLGVHWPTDVLAAMCMGTFIALAISMAIDLRSHAASR